MEKKKKTLYEISKDLMGLNDLLDNLVDEDGNPRAPTEEECETMKEWFKCSSEEFTKKFDNYCKFIKVLKNQADNAKSEKDNFKAEIDRLSKRERAFENRRKSVIGLLQWCMESLHQKKFKSDLFSAGIQEAQISVNALAGARLEKVPECYLKPREIDATAIKEAIKNGKILLGKDVPGVPLIKHDHLFDAATKEEIPEIRWTKGTFLVIR